MVKPMNSSLKVASKGMDLSSTSYEDVHLSWTGINYVNVGTTLGLMYCKTGQSKIIYKLRALKFK